MKEIITEEEYDRLSWFIQNKYNYCKKCDRFYYIHPRNAHQCEPMRTYRIQLDMVLVFPLGDDMKTPDELGKDIVQMIADEVTISGGVMSYQIKVDD